MAVLNKLLMVLVAIVLCVVLARTIRTNHRRHMATQYNGDGECVYLERVGLLGCDGYEIVFKKFPLNQEFQASYVLKNVPVNNQPYIVALQVQDVGYGFIGIDESILSMRLTDNNGIVYFDVADQIKKFTHAYPPFHLYYSDPYSDPVFSRVSISKGLEYTLDVHYIPSDIIGDKFYQGYFFLKTGGFK